MPSKKRLLQSWEKYGLIVVGNIVFFALLYFISYRPHNEENRAAEFLSLAQQEETADNWTTALVLYKKIISDYPETRSANTANYRVEHLNKNKPVKAIPEAKTAEPIVDLDKMLDQKPAVYIARFLAKQYNRRPDLKTKIKGAVGNYLKIAINYDGVLLKTLKAEAEFQHPDFKESFFTVKGKCRMKSDWVYDDFYIQNTSIFPWHNVRVEMQVEQGTGKTSKELRIPLLRPGRSHEVLSFRVSKTGGELNCRGTIKTREGNFSFQHNL